MRLKCIVGRHLGHSAEVRVNGHKDKEEDYVEAKVGASVPMLRASYMVHGKASREYREANEL